MFYILMVVIVTGAYAFVKMHHIIYIKWVHFILCKLYQNSVWFGFFLLSAVGSLSDREQERKDYRDKAE